MSTSTAYLILAALYVVCGFSTGMLAASYLNAKHRINHGSQAIATNDSVGMGWLIGLFWPFVFVILIVAYPMKMLFRWTTVQMEARLQADREALRNSKTGRRS